MKFLPFQRSAIIKVPVLSDVVALIHHPCSRALDDCAGAGFAGARAVLELTCVSCNSQLGHTSRNSGLTRLTWLQAPFQPVFCLGRKHSYLESLELCYKCPPQRMLRSWHLYKELCAVLFLSVPSVTRLWCQWTVVL